MMNAEERFAEIVAVYKEDTAVTPAKMFGATGLKVNGKVFALLVKGSLVVKLPKQRVDTLVAGGLGINFDPGHGRLMKEWLTVPQIFQTVNITFPQLHANPRPVTAAINQPSPHVHPHFLTALR